MVLDLDYLVSVEALVGVEAEAVVVAVVVAAVVVGVVAESVLIVVV